MCMRAKWKFDIEQQEWVQVICILIKVQVQNVLVPEKKNVLMIPLTLFTCKLTRADLIGLGYCVITVLKSRGHQNMANLGSNPSSTIY